MPRDSARGGPRRPPARPTKAAAKAAAARAERQPRTAVVGIAALVILLAAGAFWWFRRPARFVLPPPSQDMNVLLVTIDTLRADMLSSYGGPVPTPNLDALATHGARFTFAHSHAVVTLVSHTSILTGELPYQHGVRDNSGFRVPAGTQTVATRLKAAGFATGAFIGGYPLTKRFGLTPGFDAYDDQLPETQGIGSFALPERRAEVVVSRAVDWIGKQNGRFFSWVHVFDPHAPYRPPEAYVAEFAGRPHGDYYGEIAYVDHSLGPLFDKLATLPRPTLVIVTADHGESLGEHGELTHGMFAAEATLHIPLIIATVTPAAPHDSSGVVIDAPAAHIDLLPTILDAVGVSADPALKGGSLRNVIATDRRPDASSYFESMTFNLTRGWAPLRGVLAGRTKFIDLPIPELYNLVPDPTEQTNLASSEPDQLRQFHQTVVAFDTKAPAVPMAEGADVQKALGSLSYLTTRAAQKSSYTAADDPKTLAKVDSEIHAAQDLFEKGQQGESIARLSKVLEDHPALGDVAVYLAYAQWETGRPADAIRTLESALAHHATDSNVSIRLGLYLAESHTDPTRAIAILQTLPPTNVEALNGLGVAYVDAGRPADALATFRKLLTLDPTNGLALQNIGSIQLQRAQALAPTDPRRGPALAEAVQTLREALEADPSLPDAYNTLGAAQAAQGLMPDAIASWKQAVGIDPRNFDALDNLVMGLNGLGQFDAARAYAKQYVATAPPERYGKRIEELRKFIGS
jgi:arylsulfatase A-like enzyme/Tfp pilus assembly protein PilF